MKLIPFVRPFGRSLKRLLLLLTLPAVVQAQSYTNNYGTWTYTVYNGFITITTYTGSGGAVTIPDGIPETPIGLQVTRVGYEAFEETGLTSVTIPSSVTNIGQFAFDGCPGLTSFTIPGSFTTIEY